MSKHRLGPWSTRYRDRDGDPLCVWDAGGRIVADLRLHATTAEADLIAAAPDLLAVCKDIRDFLRSRGYDLTLVDTAIQKAEGRQS